MIAYLLKVRSFFRVVITAAYLLLIVTLSLLPPTDLPKVELFEGFDKLVHFLMYFPLAALLCWSLKVEMKTDRIWIVIALAVLWGIGMELMQLAMHLGRSFSWYDELSNFIGAVFGTFLYRMVTVKFGLFSNRE
jgi:VanZ family protein